MPPMSPIPAPVTAISTLLAIEATGLSDTTLASPQSKQPLPPAPATSAAVLATLSETAQQLSAWLATPAASATALPSAHPLLSSPPANAPQLAHAIEQGLTHSGLFYESHLAELNSGLRDASSLRQEPQASLNPADPEHMESLQTFARAQLELLDTRQIHWIAEAWPGQALDWTLWQEQNNDKHSPHQPGDADDVRIWHSTLKLSMPTLGEITVRLTLQGERLQLTLQTSQAGTAQKLAQHHEHLISELAQSGMRLDAFNTL